MIFCQHFFNLAKQAYKKGPSPPGAGLNDCLFFAQPVQRRLGGHLLGLLFAAALPAAHRGAVQVHLHKKALVVVRTLLAHQLVGQHLPALPLDQLLEGDYEAVYESFREDIRADLTAQSVQDLVEPVFQEAGDYQELKSAQVTGSTEGEEHGIAQLLCIFSQEKVSIRVAFDPDMELIGLSAGLQKSSWSLSNLVNNFTGLFRGD